MRALMAMAAALLLAGCGGKSAPEPAPDGRGWARSADAVCADTAAELRSQGAPGLASELKLSVREARRTLARRRTDWNAIRFPAEARPQRADVERLRPLLRRLDAAVAGRRWPAVQRTTDALAALGDRFARHARALGLGRCARVNAARAARNIFEPAYIQHAEDVANPLQAVRDRIATRPAQTASQAISDAEDYHEAHARAVARLRRMRVPERLRVQGRGYRHALEEVVRRSGAILDRVDAGQPVVPWMLRRVLSAEVRADNAFDRLYRAL